VLRRGTYTLFFRVLRAGGGGQSSNQTHFVRGFGQL
jgi:hypothetical protein